MADRLRGIDVDSNTGSELSDADSDLTGVISMFSKARVSENKDSRRDHKFFFDYISQSLALTRTLESIAFANGSNKKARKNNSQGFSTGTDDGTNWVCLLPDCKQNHLTARKRPAQSLTFCSKFRELKLGQRLQTYLKHKVCTRCLQPGHVV